MFDVQIAWRLGDTAYLVCFLVHLVPCVWRWIWNVGLNIEFGPECEHIQRLC